MNLNSKIYIAGHAGMVGSAIWRNLVDKGYKNLIGRFSKELDLRAQSDVEEFFNKEKPEYVFLSAAKVGGILANNTYKAEFIYNNLAIQNNIIHQSYLNDVKKLLFLGSSCIYPKNCAQPIKEEYLLTGPLEPTNEPYAIAKIAGIKLCESYYSQYEFKSISVMPTNLYGQNDNYDLKNSHVLPALLRKFHEGKINKNNEVEIWGTGRPIREFLHVDDLADACVFIMENVEPHEIYDRKISHLNIGSGEEVSIRELALIIKEVTEYKGDLVFNEEKPDGMYRKFLDTKIINKIGWSSKIKLKDGITNLYKSLYN